MSTEKVDRTDRVNRVVAETATVTRTVDKTDRVVRVAKEP